MKQIVINVIAVSALTALSACAAGGHQGDHGDQAHQGAGGLFCPNVAVLQQASQLDAFLPDQPDLAGQVTEALVTGVAGHCDLEGDHKTLRVSFQIGFDASNGPANDSRTLELPYFVSVVRGEQILAKSEYTIPVAFEGHLSSAAAASPTITEELPNVPDTADVQVLVGFQLTPEQLVYAQDHPAR